MNRHSSAGGPLEGDNSVVLFYMVSVRCCGCCYATAAVAAAVAAATAAAAAAALLRLMVGHSKKAGQHQQQQSKNTRMKPNPTDNSYLHYQLAKRSEHKNITTTCPAFAHLALSVPS
jgi:hypothetical protein